jgi:hypothetical protein
MSKRRDGSQIGNLTFDHNSYQSRGQMRSDWGMLYIVGKKISRAIRYYPCALKIDLIWEKYERPKFWDNKSPSFGSHGESDIWM